MDPMTQKPTRRVEPTSCITMWIMELTICGQSVVANGQLAAPLPKKWLMHCWRTNSKVHILDSSIRATAAAGTFAWAEDAEPFIVDAARSMKVLGIPLDIGEHIARLYGTEWTRIANVVEQSPLSAARRR